MRLPWILLLLVSIPVTARAEELLDPPDAKAQAETEALIKDIFKEDYASSKSADRAALVQKLFKQADESKSDKTSLYVLLREAGQVAAAAGDMDAVLAANSLISQSFKVDASTLNRTTIPILTANTKNPQVLKILKSMQTLLDNPEDPDANLEAGKYYCFQRMDWKAGLPLLAKSSDASLKKIAAAETTPATDAPAQMAIADLWWDRAQDEATGPQKVAVLLRAKYWYDEALPKLNGLQKKKAEMRVAELSKITPPKNIASTPRQTQPQPQAKVQPGQPASVLEIDPTADMTEVLARLNVAVTDGRDYKITRLPEEMKDARLLVRHYGRLPVWLDKSHVKLNRPAVAYVAIRWKNDNEVFVTPEQFARFASGGWEAVSKEFATSTYQGQKWEWKVFRRLLQVGPVNLPQAELPTLPINPKKMCIGIVFMFKTAQ